MDEIGVKWYLKSDLICASLNFRKDTYFFHKLFLKKESSCEAREGSRKCQGALTFGGPRPKNLHSTGPRAPSQSAEATLNSFSPIRRF